MRHWLFVKFCGFLPSSFSYFFNAVNITLFFTFLYILSSSYISLVADYFSLLPLLLFPRLFSPRQTRTLLRSLPVDLPAQKAYRPQDSKRALAVGSHALSLSCLRKMNSMAHLDDFVIMADYCTLMNEVQSIKVCNMLQRDLEKVWHGADVWWTSGRGVRAPVWLWL